jgi:hypothetical protein
VRYLLHAQCVFLQGGASTRTHTPLPVRYLLHAQCVFLQGGASTRTHTPLPVRYLLHAQCVFLQGGQPSPSICTHHTYGTQCVFFYREGSHSPSLACEHVLIGHPGRPVRLHSTAQQAPLPVRYASLPLDCYCDSGVNSRYRRGCRDTHAPLPVRYDTHVQCVSYREGCL